MGYKLWDPKNWKMVCSKDVIFDETCMYKKLVEPQGPTRVIIDDDGHQGQLLGVNNQPTQHHDQPIDDAQNGQNG